MPIKAKRRRKAKGTAVPFSTQRQLEKNCTSAVKKSKAVKKNRKRKHSAIIENSLKTTTQAPIRKYRKYT